MKAFFKKSDQVKYYCYTPSKTKAVKLAKEIQGHFASSPKELKNLDIYLIACKPQQFDQLVQNFKEVIGANALIISLMAGVDLKTIQTKLNVKKVVRLMPNTPSEYSFGFTLMSYSQDVVEDKKWVKGFVESFSSYREVTEEELDSLTVFTGSGPGLLLNTLSCYIETLISEGVNASEAEEMLRAVFIGTSELLKNSNASVVELTKAVTSAKGITAAAIDEMNESGLKDIIKKGILRGQQRTEELKRG